MKKAMLPLMKIYVFDSSTGAHITSVELTNGLIEIGRKSSCTINVPGHYGAISGIHASLRSSGGDVEIIDGDGKKPSGNGIFVNGKKIPQETWVSFTLGDKVSLGIPGASGSLLLNLGGPEVSNRVGPVSPTTSSSIKSNTSPQRIAQQPTNSRAGHYHGNSPGTKIGKSTLSSNMQARIDRIEQYTSTGYVLRKSNWCPVFVSQDGRQHSISLLSNNPAGFSWIGFFFAFAVCTQIREWSYFYVLGIANFTLSLLSILFKRDVTFAADIGIAIMYGIYFPYLRCMALSQALPEIGKGRSIIQGIFLSIIVVVPGSLLTYFFLPS